MIDRCPEVTFKYYLPENEDSVYLHVNSAKMYDLIFLIDQKCKNAIKCNESMEESRFADEIRDMIHSVINLDIII